jgi:hypothetical protein
MADDKLEQHDPGRSGQPPHDDVTDETRRAAGRRRVIMTGLLTPPAVMTLRARSAAAASAHPSMDPKYQAASLKPATTKTTKGM